MTEVVGPVDSFIYNLGHVTERVGKSAALAVGDVALSKSKLESQKVHYGKLYHICLCRSNGNFGTCVGINQHIGFSCNRASLRVNNCESLSTHALCKSHSRKRVGCLSRLRDNNYQVALMNKRLTVTELGSNINNNRHLCQLFNNVFSDHTGMHGSTAGDNVNLIDFLKPV